MQLPILLKDIRGKLEAAGIENAALDARLLVQHALGFSPEDMISSREITLSETQIGGIDALVRRRLEREPVSRILGRREFWGLNFFLSEETLDPRPDSETLIESALEILHARKDEPLCFLDLGTGTGCLLLALLSEFPAARGVGLDISADAVATAKKNAAQLSMDNRAEFFAMSWGNFFPKEKFDLVISNPPYIPDADIPGLAPEVLRFDPHRALAGGGDGLGCYRSIAERIGGFLIPGGFAVLETGWDQAEEVSEILRLARFSDVQIRKDISGNNRCVYGRFLP